MAFIADKETQPVNTNPSDSQISIQPANWRDLNQLRELEKICFPLDAWPLWDLIGVLTLPNIVRLKAVVDERTMVGFVASDERPSEKLAWIAIIGVLPEYRRRGVATALLHDTEKQLREPRVRLCVRVSNQGAIDLYVREGYREITVWSKYYQNGEDALVMEKVLT